MSEFTAKDNYWLIVSWWDMPYGKVPKGMWIGHARDQGDKIYWENPRPPLDPGSILGWDRHVDDQIWERTPLPLFWQDDYLRDMAVERFSSGSTQAQREANADYYFYKKTENQTDEQYDYQDREWERFDNGLWIMVNGVVTYITGAYYCYLQWWWLADGYPEFRERDLIVFYAFEAMVQHPLCKGGIFPKHRRSGDTSKWAFMGVFMSIRIKAGHFGIQAAGDDGAQKVFTDKVLPGFKRLPPFLKPITSGGDNTKGGIVMDVESRRGRKQHTTVKHEGLEGWIKYAPNGNVGVAPFDGDKITFYFRDEGGKADKTDILDTWDLVSPTLGMHGKAVWASTVEDVQGKHKGKFKQLYVDSRVSLLESNETGATVSGLWALFLPCYCAHDGDKKWFIGKFGESIVHKPTPAQREWLLANRCRTEKEREVLGKIYDQGGAYEYELRIRAANGNDPSHVRKWPFTIEDVFAINNEECQFNIANLNRHRELLCSMIIDESGRVMQLRDKLVVRGRLKWKAGLCSDVIFVEDPTGPFEFNRLYLPGNERAARLRIEANRIGRDQFGVFPLTGSRIIVGFDPQKSDADDSTGHKSGLSKAAGHGFIPYDPTVDRELWDESDPNFAEDYISHAFIFQYFVLPKTSFGAAEDMLMACMFLNAKFHSERQVATAIQYFKNVGAARYILYDARLNGVSSSSKKVAAGQASTDHTHAMADGLIRDYVQFFSWPDKNPFLDTIDQWIVYNGHNNNVLDLKVSSGMTFMGATPTGVMEHKRQEAMKHSRPDKLKSRNQWLASMTGVSGGISI